MKEVSDGFDILVAVVALLFILTVGIWSIASVRSNMDVQVDEKMVAHNTFGQEIVRPVQTAKDALMSLVVNDAYVPDPVTVVFQYGRETYTVVFDNASPTNVDTHKLRTRTSPSTKPGIPSLRTRWISR